MTKENINKQFAESYRPKNLANGLIFGQSGSGKSYWAKKEIIHNLLDEDNDIIILDPENEYRCIADDYGGVVIDLAPKSGFYINPCDMSMEWSEPEAAPLAEKCNYMVSLVESILGKCTDYEANAVHRACTRMYEPYIQEMTRRHNNGNSDNIDTSICPTLKDFYNELITDDSTEGNRIAKSIEPYCIGDYDLFAHHTNVRTGDRLTIFNISCLPEKIKEMAMKVCLANIWLRIVENKTHAEKSVWIYFDEFHHFLKTEDSADVIAAYFKRACKYGGIMTGIMQDIADVLRTPQGTEIFNNIDFFVQLYGTSYALIDNMPNINVIGNNNNVFGIQQQSPEKKNEYKEIIDYLNDLPVKERRRAILSVIEYLEDNFPLKKET